MIRWNDKMMLLDKGWQMKQQYPLKEQKKSRDQIRKYLRLVAGSVCLSTAGLFIASSFSTIPSLYTFRKLSVASHSEFIPQLSFTGPGTFPNPHHVQVNFSIDGSVNPSASLEEDHSQEWHGTQTVEAGKEFTFVLMHFITRVIVRTGCPEGIIAWFESVDTKAVFAIPAFYKNGGKDLIVRTSIVDPGEYRVHLVGFQSIKIEEGSHGTVGDVRPIAGSPWTLEVMPGDTQRGFNRDNFNHNTIRGLISWTISILSIIYVFYSVRYCYRYSDSSGKSVNSDNSKEDTTINNTTKKYIKKFKAFPSSFSYYIPLFTLSSTQKNHHDYYNLYCNHSND